MHDFFRPRFVNPVDQFIERGKAIGRRAYCWGAAASSAPYTLPLIVDPQILETDVKFLLPKLGAYHLSNGSLIMAGIAILGFISPQVHADELLYLMWGMTEKIQKRAVLQTRAAISSLYLGGIVSFGVLTNDLIKSTNNHGLSLKSAVIALACSELCARGARRLYNKIRKENENPLILG